MPNIYLRLPTSRCQFFRNLEEGKSLLPHEPFVFSEFSEEYFVLSNALYNTALSTDYDTRFFSHQQWKNMLRGKDPLGKTLLYTRDPSKWLSYEEVSALLGRKENNKSDIYDYLCIKLPNEVFYQGAVHNVSPTWCITKEGFYALTDLLNNTFKRTVINWSLATFDFVTSKRRVIMRTQQAMLERFLIRYNIFPSDTEKANLRRVIDRWFAHNNANLTGYSNLHITYEDLKEKSIPVNGTLHL